jgi:hypothetical protein
MNEGAFQACSEELPKRQLLHDFLEETALLV